MCSTPDCYINDARNFQKYSQFDLAIDSLKKAQKMDQQHEFGVEIQKLLSFNYRKLGDWDLALFYINNAINSISAQTNNMESQKEYAICLMNKGIIYEEIESRDKALKCYLSALKIFNALFDSDPDNYGIIINALLTIGMLYDSKCEFSKEREYLERALPYFGSGKETDRRYQAIMNMLTELKGK